MKPEHAHQIVQWLSENRIHAYVYHDYSGRGMYGRTTAGVVTHNVTDVFEAKGALKIHDDFARDSMGLDTIVY